MDSAGKVRQPTVAEKEAGPSREQETSAGREVQVKDRWGMNWTVQWEHCGQVSFTNN